MTEKMEQIKNYQDDKIGNILAERGRFELPVPLSGTHPFQGCALGHYATSPKNESLASETFGKTLERVAGLEPATAAMARRYSSQLSYTRKKWDTEPKPIAMGLWTHNPAQRDRGKAVL